MPQNRGFSLFTQKTTQISETRQILEPGAVDEGRLPPGGCGLCRPTAGLWLLLAFLALTGLLSTYAGSQQKVSDMSGDGPDDPLRASALVRRALESSMWAVGVEMVSVTMMMCPGGGRGPSPGAIYT